VLGFGVCGAGWLLLAVAPLNAYGIAAYAMMLLMFGIGAVFIFINFLALRQSVTPGRMLGRMTSTMRWLILLPAAPGALLGGLAGRTVWAASDAWLRGRYSPSARTHCVAPPSDSQREDVTDLKG
jgi:hypothetical protein